MSFAFSNFFLNTFLRDTAPDIGDAELYLILGTSRIREIKCKDIYFPVLKFIPEKFYNPEDLLALEKKIEWEIFINGGLTSPIIFPEKHKKYYLVQDNYEYIYYILNHLNQLGPDSQCDNVFIRGYMK